MTCRTQMGLIALHTAWLCSAGGLPRQAASITTAKAAAVSSLHHPIRRATKESSRRDIRLNLTLTSSKIRGPYKEDLLKDFACPQDDDMHRIGRTESDFLPWILYDSARIIDTAVGIRVVLFPCINTPLPKDDL
ncbi:hypothetical protein U9M48_032649, partial [Paspalum notatum var. saurae]